MGMLFAIITFGIITDQSCYPFSGNSDYESRAKFVVAVGVIAFISNIFALAGFLLFDIDSLPRIAWLIKLAFTGLWTVMWFICAVVWAAYINENQFELYFSFNVCSKSRNQAAAAFAFLSCFIWIGMAALTFLKMRGASESPSAPQEKTAETYNYPAQSA